MSNESFVLNRRSVSGDTGGTLSIPSVEIRLRTSTTVSAIFASTVEELRVAPIASRDSLNTAICTRCRAA